MWFVCSNQHIVAEKRLSGSVRKLLQIEECFLILSVQDTRERSGLLYPFRRSPWMVSSGPWLKAYDVASPSSYAKATEDEKRSFADFE